jgi:hypothetical protein
VHLPLSQTFVASALQGPSGGSGQSEESTHIGPPPIPLLLLLLLVVVEVVVLPPPPAPPELDELAVVVLQPKPSVSSQSSAERKTHPTAVCPSTRATGSERHKNKPRVRIGRSSSKSSAHQKAAAAGRDDGDR